MSILDKVKSFFGSKEDKEASPEQDGSENVSTRDNRLYFLDGFNSFIALGTS